MKTKIIFEDTNIIVCHKPSGLATQSGKIGQADVETELKKYLVTTTKNPPYIGVVHRLDQPVEGLLVFGKTKEATGNLSKQLKHQTLNKEYLAIVEGRPKEQEATVVNYMKKVGSLGIITKETDQEAKKAILQYKILEYNKEKDISLLDIKIETGRFHQIRVQLSQLGFPLLGDMKYGTSSSYSKSKELGIRNCTLFAYGLAFEHPITKKKMDFSIEEEYAERKRFR